MRKLWISALFLALLALSACGQKNPVPAVTPTRPAAQTPAQSVTLSPPPIPTVAFPASDLAKCTASSAGTPAATLISPYPKPSSNDWVQGPSTAKVTFIEYSDFQCPYCAQLEPVLEQLVKTYPNDVRVVYRNFPLSIHDKSLISAQAAEAAGAQGKFQELKQILFARQAEWTRLSQDDFESWVTQQAKSLGLDDQKFVLDMKSTDLANKVKKDVDSATSLNITGTPFLVINERPYYGAGRDFNSLSTIVKLVLLENKQFTQCPDMTINLAKQYTATIKTDQGDIVIQLLAKQAPMAVNNFVFLAQKGWYNDNMFFRVLPGFVAQAGDPTDTGYGSPGYTFSNEVIPDLRFDKPGLVGMANAGPDGNGSQFFITYAPAQQLDGQYTIFGQVIQGMDVAGKLTPRDPTKAGLMQDGSKILSITIEEK